MTTLKTANDSIQIYATTGELLDIQIESRNNKNGYIDYSKPSLFICKAMKDGTPIYLQNSSYSWSLKTSTGDVINISSSTTILNSLKLKSKVLKPDNEYLLSCTATYGTLTNTATIEYNTIFDTDYIFDVSPSSGKALTSEFLMTIMSQSLIPDVSKFTFGYTLARSSIMTAHEVILPYSSGPLEVFCEISSPHGKIFYLTQNVTVSQTNMSVSNFENFLDETAAMSVDESVRIRLMYEHFKNDVNTTVRISALNLILNGIGTREPQDQSTRLIVAQVLNMIGGEFEELNEEEVIVRAIDVFYGMMVSVNEQISDGLFFEVSEQMMSDLFEFADSALDAITIVNITQQKSMKQKLYTALEYAIRGSTANEAPVNSAIEWVGSSVSILTNKINANAFTDEAISNITTSNNDTFSIIVPKSAMRDSEYSQLTVMFKQSTASRRMMATSVMTDIDSIKVVLSETESTMSISESEVKNSEIEILALAEPLRIHIPTDSVTEGYALACLYTDEENEEILDPCVAIGDGLDYCVCNLTKYTEFSLKEYEPDGYAETQVEVVEESDKVLRIERSIAFWLSLLMLIALPFLLFKARKMDIADIKKFGPEGPSGIKQYALFMVVRMSVRSKEKALKKSKMNPNDKPDGNIDGTIDQTIEVSQMNNTANMNTSDMNLVKMQSTKQNLDAIYNNEEEKDDDPDFFRAESRGAAHDQIKIGGFDDDKQEELKQRDDEEELDDIEEIHGEPVAQTVIKKNDPLENPDIDTGIVSREERERIQKQLNKRKKKKKKRSHKMKSNFVEDNLSVGESIQKADSVVSKGSGTAIKREGSKFKANSGNKSQTESDIDLEGGDGHDDADNNTTNTNAVNTDGDAIGIFNTDGHFDDTNRTSGIGLKTKKRKKKLIRKVKKKSQFKRDEEEKVQELPANFRANEKAVPFKLKGRYDPTNAQTSNLSDSESNVSKEEEGRPKSPFDPSKELITIDPETKSNEGVDDGYEYKDKAQERHYDGKYYCRTLKYGYRFANMLTFFDERCPRMLRVMAIYNTSFIVMFASGMFFLSYSETGPIKSSPDLIICFAIALFCTLTDWFMYFMFYFMFLQKPRHLKKYKYMIEQNANQIDQTSEDISEMTRSRPPTSNSSIKVIDLDDDSKRKNINKNATVLGFVFSAIIILACWVFIIIMGSSYSLKAGNMWAISLSFTILLDFFIVELAVLYFSSKYVYDKAFDLREERFRPVEVQEKQVEAKK